MYNQTKRDYDRYIQMALNKIQKCREYDLVPYNIEKILKKQANKRLLEKIGELSQQLDLQYVEDDKKWKKIHLKIEEESLKEYGVPIQCPPVSIASFHTQLSDTLWYSMEVYHEDYSKTYKHICERVQASKNQMWLRSRSSGELDAIFNTIPPKKIYDATVGFIKMSDLLYEYRVNY